jgi:hypothetical protein
VNSAAARQVELILHVGFHKTGSSSIQETFSKLEMPHIQYANWGHINHSGCFMFAFFEPKSAIYGVGKTPEAVAAAEAHGERLRTRLKMVLETCPKPAVLISGEDISSIDNLDAVRAFREFVGPYVSAIRVHAYVRPHPELMASTIQQYVKMGTLCNLNSVIPLRPRFDMLDEVFGPENVQYHCFRSSSLVDGDVAKDLAHHLGVTLADQQIVRANESISAEAMGVLYCHLSYGRHRLGYESAANIQNMLVKELEALGSTPFRFSAELTQKNLDSLGGDVAWVEQRMGLTSAIPSHGGGVTTDEDLLAVGVAQHDRLAAMMADLARREGCTAVLPAGPVGPQQIAAMVDLIKDMLRAKFARNAEAARESVRQKKRIATEVPKRAAPPMSFRQKLSHWMKG